MTIIDDNVSLPFEEQAVDVWGSGELATAFT